jgi:phage head maturation protease
MTTVHDPETLGDQLELTDTDLTPDPEALRGLEVVRYVITPVVFRDAAGDAEDAGDSLGTLDVRFSPFNTWYEIDSWWEGRFLERTVKGAFLRTIGQHNDPNSSHNMKTLFNHGMDMYVNDKLLGDITDAREESDSPVNTVNLWDTSYNRDLLPGLRRGSYGSSFMFRVTKEEWNNEPGVSEHNPEGLPERTIKETTTFEAGPVTWPASPTASAGMRCASGTDAYYDALARRDPSKVARMRQNVIALRSARRLADTGARPADGLAPAPPTDSAPGRSRGLSPAERSRRLRMSGRT